MTTMEKTRQQLDPVGALPTRILSVIFAAGAFGYGVVMTLRATDQIVNPTLSVLALSWLAAAAITVSIASAPSRAPFTQSTHVAVQLLALGAVALSAASQWGSNNFIQDDFGSLSLGLLILAMGVYRPAKELASIGALSGLCIGFITLLQVPNFATHAPAASFILVSMTPVLALAFGSAEFSRHLVGELERWQTRSARSVAKASIRLTTGIAKSVRQDRVKILDRDVFPFFNFILNKEVITLEDRLQARKIAESIRLLMVAEADRTWLEVVARDDGVSPVDMQSSIDDATGRASKMVAEQRTVLRALIVAIREDQSFVATSLKVSIFGRKELSRGLLGARFHPESPDPRDIFAPYFAVMRIVFTDVVVDFKEDKLTVKFTYGKH
ncbi:MAG: hypothetical protein ABIW32_06750 [Terrimesophilobacter sp.]